MNKNQLQRFPTELGKIMVLFSSASLSFGSLSQVSTKDAERHEIGSSSQNMRMEIGIPVTKSNVMVLTTSPNSMRINSAWVCSTQQSNFDKC